MHSTLIHKVIEVSSNHWGRISPPSINKNSLLQIRMNIEQWRPVKGHESQYLISNTGRIQLVETGEIKEVKAYNGARKCGPFNYVKTMRENWAYEWIRDLDEHEEVKPIKDHPDYFITSKGRVFGMKYYRWLKPQRHGDYYHRIRLDGKLYLLHTMVGRHFIKDYTEGLQILHTDETLPFPQIHSVENLWVGSVGDNIRDALRKGRAKSSVSVEDVHAIREISKEGRLSQREIAEMFSIRKQLVSSILRGNSYAWA